MTDWRPEIEGWSSDILPYYETIANELPDGAQVAEVGVYKGRSLLWLAEQFAARGKLAVRLYGIDTWEASWAPGLWEAFCRNLGDTAESARSLIIARRGPSNVMATGFDDASLDMIFIDGDHNYESVRADIAAWRSKVRPGGIISGHDYSGDMYGSFPGVDRAVHEAFGQENVLKPSGSVWRIR